MDLKITLEWDEEIGLSINKMYSFRETIEEDFKNKNYGTSVLLIGIILVCRPYDFKQRIRFKKSVSRFEYDILLDYFLIKNIELGAKKEIIKRQIRETTVNVFSKYKFEDFDTKEFIVDFEKILNSINW